jgi:hypothetical protein
VDLSNIQALFDSYRFRNDDSSSTSSSDLEDPYEVHVQAYPLAFLRSFGNIQADGIPCCFYPELAKINQSVRKGGVVERTPSDEEDSEEDEDEDLRFVDAGDRNFRPSLQPVKAVSAQFYNYITHRVASRAGRHDAQQGMVMAAISGGFADSTKDKNTALRKQSHCDQGLPSERFHSKISLEDCPTSCRAEIVYSVDVRALKNRSGTHVVSFFFQLAFVLLWYARSYRSIFKDIVLPLARCWSLGGVRKAITEHLLVLKPEVRVTVQIHSTVSFRIHTDISRIVRLGGLPHHPSHSFPLST